MASSRRGRSSVRSVRTCRSRGCFFVEDAAASEGRSLSDRRLSAERCRMALIAAIALAGLLPLAPAPAAPFPRIITDAATLSEVAPGVGYGSYEMLTADGPLSVHVL